MDVVMPQLGETVREGTISAWFKQAGEHVNAGENLFEIETDKVSMEVQALESGIISEIRVPAGATASVGTVVAVIGAPSAKAAGSAEPVPAAASQEDRSAPSGRDEPGAPEQPRAAPETNYRNGTSLDERGFAPFNEVFTPSGNFGPAKMPDGMRITPLARRLIAQNNLDRNAIAQMVRAAGRNKISAKDVQAAGSNMPMGARAPAPVIAGNREQVALNRVRRQTARHLQNAWQTAPHVFQAMEIDFGAVDNVRNAQKDAFKGANGFSLTFLPFIARAVCLAIRSYPNINAAFDGEKLHVSKDIHLGVAVDLDHQGLVVPVIRHADGYSVPGLARAIQAQADKARNGKLSPDDLEGGTYSISNNGSFGTLFTAPIINTPQVAILSTDAIRKRAMVKETEYGDVIVARPAGIVTQSFDHRAFDGAYSATFLSHLKAIIESRDWNGEFN